MTSGVKLLAGALIVAVAIGYLAFLGAAGNWQYYLSVDEAVADEVELAGKRIRVSGNVVAGSLRVSDDRREAEFDLTGKLHSLHASCSCAIPDNLADDMDVVVEGELAADGMHGHKVVTRCASKYQPKVAIAERVESPGTSVTR